MKLYYFVAEDSVPNFGDDLNAWLWPQLLGDFLDEDERELFIGFGTIINERLPKADKLHIFSSGYGYERGKVVVLPNWVIHCVRGPMSERALGLESGKGVIDGAVLVATQYKSLAIKKYEFSFIPHVKNAHKRWEDLCQKLDIHYIDPTDSVEEVLEEISASKVLLAEAMHGAIVSDALRVPWIPIKSSKNINSFKWQDFCASVDIKYSPYILPPMSPLNKRNPIAVLRATAKWWWCYFSMKKIVKNAKPILSNAAVLQNRIDELMKRLESLRQSKNVRIT